MPTKKQSSRKLLKKGGEGYIDNICIQETINCNNYMQILDEDNSQLDTEDKAKGGKDLNLYTKILKILNRGAGNERNINNITTLLKDLFEQPHLYDKVIQSYHKDEDTYLKGIRKPNVTGGTLPGKDNVISDVIATNIFDDIEIIVKNFKIYNYIDGIGNIDTNHHFQTEKFTDMQKGVKGWDPTTLWGKYNLGSLEKKQIFITIDPTIIQLLIFDNNKENYKHDGQDIVYSLKLIIRPDGYLQLRYTTHLFPYMQDKKINSYIPIDFNDINNFGEFNKSLGNKTIKEEYDDNINKFLRQYIKFYEFYKKCYELDSICIAGLTKGTKLIDYQLKYISILGKARFGNEELKKRTAVLTDYVMGNLIFANPTYGFISGGYKGFKSDKYGITRSGYEIAKKYNRPVLTIMCQEGTHDAHEFSDATLIYGEHWGEDTIALSQLTDGAIVIAPFGGWTYVECLALLAKRKIVGIYNDFFNILNYQEKPTELEIKSEVSEEKAITPNFDDKEIEKILNNKYDDKEANINFFNFLRTEQNSIIDYYINYYIILLYIICKDNHNYEEDTGYMLSNDAIYAELCRCLNFGIKILTYLKTLIKIPNIHTNHISKKSFISVINACNELKRIINSHVNAKLVDINIKYTTCISKNLDKTYQNKIPKNCDGIWTKPLFDLTELCPEITREQLTIKLKGGNGHNKRLRKRGGGCTIDGDEINADINIHKINYEKLLNNEIFEKLNNNIIFVFSDPLYLNMYLTENLNKSTFQKEIQQKIKQLQAKTGTVFFNEQSYRTLKNLAPDGEVTANDVNKYLRLNRNLDGMYTPDGELIRNNILRERYSFFIDDTCNNYTALLQAHNLPRPTAPPLH